MKIMTKFTSTLFAAVVGLAATVLAQDAPPAAATLPPASTKTGVTYATDIKPIFDAACVKCHGEKKPGHGIVLTSLESVLKGGKDGKIIVVGDSTKGDLIASIAHTGDDPSLFMPKGKGAQKLTDDQIGLIRAWIDQGAK
jgi:mono/diheme cytochrome c family protein